VGTGALVGPQHSQAQGGQLCPAAQAGHAHPQLPPGTGRIWTHDPLGQGVVTHTTPSSIQLHALALSAMQLVTSPWLAHGSAAASRGPAPEAPLLTPTLPVPQAQSQGAQLAPAGQDGHAHVQVPLAVTPAPVTPPPQAPLPLQSQVQGGQAWPGAHTGQSQVQVPAPPLLPVAGFEQSHWTAGQSAFSGQTIGCTQVQPPPEASRVWQ